MVAHSMTGDGAWTLACHNDFKHGRIHLAGQSHITGSQRLLASRSGDENEGETQLGSHVQVVKTPG